MMKFQTILYSNKKQGILPIFFIDFLDISDSVLVFDELMKAVDLKKNLGNLPPYVTGHCRYNPINMVKTVLF